MANNALLVKMAETAFWLAQNTYCGDDEFTMANSKTHFVSGGYPVLFLSGKTFTYVIPNTEETEQQAITILKNFVPLATVMFYEDEYGGIESCSSITVY